MTDYEIHLRDLSENLSLVGIEVQPPLNDFAIESLNKFLTEPRDSKMYPGTITVTRTDEEGTAIQYEQPSESDKFTHFPERQFKTLKEIGEYIRLAIDPCSLRKITIHDAPKPEGWE